MQVCDSLTHAARPLCEGCRKLPQLASAVLTARAGRLERHHVTLARICLHCGGGGGRLMPAPGGSIPCNSLDCAVLFERRKTAHELAAASALSDAGLLLLDNLKAGVWSTSLSGIPCIACTKESYGTEVPNTNWFLLTSRSSRHADFLAWGACLTCLYNYVQVHFLSDPFQSLSISLPQSLLVSKISLVVLCKVGK